MYKKYKRQVLKPIVFLIAFVTILIPFDLSAQSEGYKLKTVVIDAGHGGRDPGTSGRYAKEKEIALKIALKLGNYIETYIPDVQVIYTRKTDKFVPLNERADIANKNKADLFISIHLNGNLNKRAYGSSTYVLGLHKTEENLEVAKLENSAILFEDDYSTKYEGFEPNSSESYIIFSLIQDTYLEQSLSYASYIQKEFEQRARRKNRGVKQAGFVVLWMTSMPSVLIEAGFLTNPQEEKYLITEQGQDYLASAIYRAFRDYKNKIEQNSSFSIAHEMDKADDISNDNSETSAFTTNIYDNDNPGAVLFKIQIASSLKAIPLNSDYFNGLEHVEEYQLNNMYKYMIGSEKSYSDISELKKKVEATFPDAFIIAMKKDSTIITVREALELIKENNQ